MKKWLLLFLAAIFAFSFMPAKAKADVFTGKGVKLYIGGKANIRPAYFYETDLDDDHDGDYPYLWEGGLVKDTEFLTEAEIRLIFKAWGENWGFLLIPEHRTHYNQRENDRSSKRNMDTEWGIEKLRLWYYFKPWLKFATGWFDPDTWLDPAGTIVYANDDPYLKFFGDITKNFYWEIVYLQVYDNYLSWPKVSDMLSKGDVHVIWLKLRYKWNNGKFSGYVSPFVAYSSYRPWIDDSNCKYLTAEIWYPGIEGKLNYGKWEFAFDIATAQGNWDSDNDYYNPYGEDDMDIDAWAWYWHLKYNYSKAFQPFVGMYYWSGDDDIDDDDIEGWVPMSGGEMLADFVRGPFSIPRDLRGAGGPIGAPLYSYQPMVWTPTNKYSGMAGIPGKYKMRQYGIYVANTGMSPGSYFVGLGAQGTVGKWSYKFYGYYYWMDEEDCLEDLAYYMVEKKVDIDSSLAWGFDSIVTYKFNNNFRAGIMFEIIDPGDGLEDWIEDVNGGDATTGFKLAATLLWKF